MSIYDDYSNPYTSSDATVAYSAPQAAGFPAVPARARLPHRLRPTTKAHPHPHRKAAASPAWCKARQRHRRWYQQPPAHPDVPRRRDSPGRHRPQPRARHRRGSGRAQLAGPAGQPRPRLQRAHRRRRAAGRSARRRAQSEPDARARGEVSRAAFRRKERDCCARRSEHFSSCWKQYLQSAACLRRCLRYRDNHSRLSCECSERRVLQPQPQPVGRPRRESVRPAGEAREVTRAAEGGQNLRGLRAIDFAWARAVPCVPHTH